MYVHDLQWGPLRSTSIQSQQRSKQGCQVSKHGRIRIFVHLQAAGATTPGRPQFGGLLHRPEEMLVELS